MTELPMLPPSPAPASPKPTPTCCFLHRPRSERAIKRTGHPKATDPNWPQPVRIPELGLLVKYGTQVTRAEVEAQRYVYKQVQGRVPVPEVMGWAEDSGQGFIYMEQLHRPCAAWRGLRQDLCDFYIGESELNGPWLGGHAVQAFQGTCSIDVEGQIPIVFTLGDLVPCNILAQVGWYPSYWEWCKCKWADMPGDRGMDEALQEQWKSRYLPLIVDALPDSTVYYPWMRFALAYGC
ncbi:hypothetical protein C8A03DRAFT_41618 [Achaetomium macrosporum]|uniref:Aminoglycoside phosphotransferase domain-containing protein n=1 Tax=Achaetomium macrosporum TaxID=79813 RepID=A0AAN7CF16_9PEZI|nr:hypothetical protein C8A03DRAFT_41618 [Achaetomium macrosporum]